MSAEHSSPIPGKLRNEGYSVFIERMNGKQGQRLWCASASRDGAERSVFGEDLGTVLIELDRQVQDEDADSREAIADEMLETARSFLGTESSSAQAN